MRSERSLRKNAHFVMFIDGEAKEENASGGRFSIALRREGKRHVNHSTKELNYSLQLKDIKYDLILFLRFVWTSINFHFYETRILKSNVRQKFFQRHLFSFRPKRIRERNIFGYNKFWLLPSEGEKLEKLCKRGSLTSEIFLKLWSKLKIL